MIIPRLPAQTLSDFMASEMRERMASTALTLFEREGFDSTTVDEIAALAGVNRRTFFRYFQAKEDAIFADQSELLNQLRSALEFGHGEPVEIVSAALKKLLGEFMKQSDLLRRRDELTIKTPALADREIIWWAEYQTLLGDFLLARAETVRDRVFAMIIAAAMLAAFRQVLANLLEGDDPYSLFADLIDDIAASMTSSGARGSVPSENHPSRRDFFIVSSDLSAEQIADLIERPRT